MVELLVVISIIGILAAVIYANFGQARTEAKNKAVRTSLSQVQLALENYKAQNDRYPAALGDLVPEFIAKLPANSDSANTSCDMDNSQYATNAGGTYYKLTAARCIGGVTAATGIQTDDEMARCPSSCARCEGSTGPALNAAYRATAAFYETLAVYSIGGECL